MKKIALIPARYASTRLPAKLVQDLGGKSVIQRTYLSTVATGVFDEVWVVTDHEVIQNQILELGGNVFSSQVEHQSGSDRIAEALSVIDGELIVNVQGDEPFQDQKSLSDLVRVFDEEKVNIATLMTRINAAEAENPNVVKVLTDNTSNAIYFSRSPIPYNREKKVDIPYWKHIGIYAYRRAALLNFTTLLKGTLESIEMLEQLRFLENGFKIRMVETDHLPVAIDTLDDLTKARKELNK
jgi:3-deoxy-manno-octulosonate cytidylyltransferase (CMP-KDO synthetase)